jgi:citrate lyase subunit beta/citryl-CoA lyase
MAGRGGPREAVVNVLDPLRSILTLSAARPDLAERVIGRGADAILVDLEGAAAPDLHHAAQEALPDLVRALRSADAVVLVRLTAGVEAQNELRRFADLPVHAFLLPNAEDPGEVQTLAAIIRSGRTPSDAGIVPLIDSARGIFAAADIAGADMRVLALGFDGEALAAELMIDPAPIGLAQPGQAVVLAARAAGRAAFGIPAAVSGRASPDLFRAACIHARSLGFAGAFCTQVQQATVANTVFRPSEDDLAWAEAVLEDLGGGRSTGATPRGRDGRLIDRTVIDRARLLTSRGRA